MNATPEPAPPADVQPGPRLILHTGPFRLRIHLEHPPTLALLRRLYRHQRIESDHQAVYDIHLSMLRPRGLRRWYRPQIRVYSDGEMPFEPFPLSHAYPLFEWSLNWRIAMQSHQYLMLHASVVEKNGRALIMPALPGSGKSTLSAALMLRGWRLLSDEFGLIQPTDKQLRLHPLPRPIPLKNESIAIIRAFSNEAELGPVFPKTRKGDVAHLMADRNSQQRGRETAAPGWILFPRYQAGHPTELEPAPPGWTFLKISGNSFNYKLQGARGFNAVADLVERHPAHSLDYSDLDQAIARIEALHDQICSHLDGRDITAPATPAPR